MMRCAAISSALLALLSSACDDGTGSTGNGGGSTQAGQVTSGQVTTAQGPGSTSGSSQTTSTTGAGGSGSWSLRQSLTKNWDAGDPSWQGGNEVSFADVAPGSTLVLAAYGLTQPTPPFEIPLDSMGQAVVVAAQTGTDRATQAAAWVMHDALGGAHTWTNLPDLSTGDGKLFFMEFDPGGGPSTEILGAATNTLDAYVPPWLTTGSVTMSSGANAGDLLVAFSFQEEGSVGNANTPYTDPPDGWSSLGVQTDTTHNIGGEACWRVAPDASPQTVTWSWQITGDQDPTVFKAVIFAVHAP